MIDDIVNDVVALFEGLRAPGKALQDFKAIVGGDTKVSTDFHPAVQFEWNGNCDIRKDGVKYVLSLGFWLSAISSSLEGRAKGRADHSKLVARVAGEQILGLVAASSYLEGYKTGSGISFHIDVEPETNPLEVQGPHKSWSFVTAQTVTFTTWLNRQQLRP